MSSSKSGVFALGGLEIKAGVLLAPLLVVSYIFVFVFLWLNLSNIIALGLGRARDPDTWKEENHQYGLLMGAFLFFVFIFFLVLALFGLNWAMISLVPMAVGGFLLVKATDIDLS